MSDKLFHVRIFATNESKGRMQTIFVNTSAPAGEEAVLQALKHAQERLSREGSFDGWSLEMEECREIGG